MVVNQLMKLAIETLLGCFDCNLSTLQNRRRELVGDADEFDWETFHPNGQAGPVTHGTNVLSLLNQFPGMNVLVSNSTTLILRVHS